MNKLKLIEKKRSVQYLLILIALVPALLFTARFNAMAFKDNKELDSPGVSSSVETRLRPKRVFLILVNDVTTRDLIFADMPNLKKLVDSRAAIGVLSDRTAIAKSGTVMTLTSIGAGNRGTASIAASNALNSFEEIEPEGKATDIYLRRTGLRPGPSRILHVGISTVKKENANLPYNIKIGLLGDELNRVGVNTAVFGNTDRGSNIESRRREAVMIATDSTGKVDYGTISTQINKPDARRPYGIRTDYEAVYREISSLPSGKDVFAVVETGDTSRAAAYSVYVDSQLYEKYQGQALGEADAFIGKLVDKYGLKDSVYMIMSTTPSQFDKREQLTPVAIFGKGFKKGILRSATTRRDGVVALPDLTATIIKMFDPAGDLPAQLAGRSAEVKESSAAFDNLEFINQKALKADVLRPAMVLIYILLQVAAFIMAGIVLWRGAYNTKVYLFARTLLLIVLSIPASFFLASALDTGIRTSHYAAVIVILTGFICLTLSLLRTALMRLLAVSLVTYMVILGDVLFGANLNMNSILGYSPIIAGRFYGIGNQAMSILLASSLVIAVLVRDLNKLKGPVADFLQITIFAVSLFVVGLPIVGANTGGAVTLLFAYWATFVYFKKQRLDVRDVVKAAAVLAGFFVFAVSGDLLFNSGSESHLSKLVLNVATNGPLELFLTIKRKLMTNMRIFRYSSWSYLFVLVVIVLSLLRYKPIGGLPDLFKKYPALLAAITGCFVGSGVGFLSNDSGMSVPALILSFFLPIILYLMLDENKKAEAHGE